MTFAQPTWQQSQPRLESREQAVGMTRSPGRGHAFRPRAAVLTAVVVSLLLTAGASAAGDLTLMATLTPSSVVPPVQSSANGSAYLFVTKNGTELRYAVSYAGLSSNLKAVTLRMGGPKENGAVVVTLATGPSTIFGVFDGLTQFKPSKATPTWDALIKAIKANRTYLSIETANHADGELRGQLILQPSSPTSTPRPTGAVAGHTTPPTDTVTPSDGESHSNLPLLLLLGAIGIAGGFALTAVVKPGPAGTRGDL